MASEPASSHQPPDPDKPPGYQPTTGRKLFMFGIVRRRIDLRLDLLLLRHPASPPH